MHALVRLLHYAKSHRGEVAIAVFFTVFNTLCDILPEVLIGLAVDVVVKRENSWIAGLGLPTLTSQVVALAIATAIIWLVESWTQYAYEVRWRNHAQAVQHELRTEAYNHVQRLDLRFFEDRRSGELLSILN